MLRNFFIRGKRLIAIYHLSRKAFFRYKKQIIILTILGFAGGVLEGIGINALIPLFSFVMGEKQGSADFISKAIENSFNSVGIKFSVKYLIIFIALLFLIKFAVTIWLLFIRVKITSDYEQKTKANLFQKLFQIKWPYLISQKLGFLETIIMIDIPASSSLLNQISALIMIGANCLIYLLIALNISLPITLITIFGGLLYFIISKPITTKIKYFSQKRAQLNREISHFVNENILGLKTIKSMSVSQGIIAKGNEHFTALRNLTLKVALYKNTSSTILQPVGMFFILVVFLYAYKSPNFSFPALIALVYLIDKIFIYTQQVQGAINNIFEGAPHLKIVLNCEDSFSANEESNQGLSKFNFEKQIRFQDVSFNYGENNETLKKLNFSIAKGEMIGLIGPSGAGKTTLVDLILRLLKPTAGNILIDDRDITEIDIHDWRKNIGYVSQDIFLVNDTIANNVRFYNDAISEKDIEAAAKMANIYDFIQTLPDKFETQIGERGILLSAGQRQRIIIARILARQPELLILDEATSALDNESEIQIQEVIESLKGKITVITIAHRLSTVKNCDRLIVLGDGRILEEGKPQDLLADKDSYFFKVYNIRE